MTWEIVTYIRDLYCVTNYTMIKISKCVVKKFGIKINFTTVHKICRNERWYDEKYIPPNKPYRKITSEVKKFILDSGETPEQIVKDIKEKFNCEITATRVRQLKEKSKQEIGLII